MSCTGKSSRPGPYGFANETVRPSSVPDDEIALAAAPRHVAVEPAAEHVQADVDDTQREAAVHVRPEPEHDRQRDERPARDARVGNLDDPDDDEREREPEGERTLREHDHVARYATTEMRPARTRSPVRRRASRYDISVIAAPVTRDEQADAERADRAVERAVRELGEPRLRDPVDARRGVREDVAVRHAVIEHVAPDAQVPEERVVGELADPDPPARQHEQHAEDELEARTATATSAGFRERIRVGAGRRVGAVADLALERPRRASRRAESWLESDVLADRDEGRPEHHDEHRREDAQHEREEHLDRCLLRELLRGEPATDAHLVGLRAQDAGDRHTERVGLQHREDERTQLGDLGALVEGAQRVGAARADPGLLQHAAELLRQRARHRSRRAVDGLLETETGFDRDHEQVEDVGQPPRDLLLAAPRSCVRARGRAARNEPPQRKPIAETRARGP